MGAKKSFIISGILFLFFIIFTIMVLFIDVSFIGPEGSKVGFSTFNKAVHEITDFSLFWYELSEILGYAAIGVILGFGAVGLYQVISRKGILRADPEIYVLGGFYVVVLAFYVLFEKFIINYRPVILDGGLEASYPSSHTMLSICVMLSAINQFDRIFAANSARRVLGDVVFAILAIVTVLSRFLSGVHWATDIAGGIILSISLFMAYYGTTLLVKKIN